MVKNYISIVDCDICAKIPQRIMRDIQHDSGDNIPVEIDKLVKLLEINEDTDQMYTSSITRILKCPNCGTYYYHNHYKDDGQHFMDPTYDEITIRRYEPKTALTFMQSLLEGKAGNLPQALGRMSKAFLDDYAPNTPLTANLKNNPEANVLFQEIQELKERYPILIEEMTRNIQVKSMNWQIAKYILASLNSYYLLNNDWENFRKILLNHKDPIIQVEVAEGVLSIISDDAPVVDLVHIPWDYRNRFKEIFNKDKIYELIQILLNNIQIPITPTQDPVSITVLDYNEKPFQAKALYGLVVANDLIDISHTIPLLISLLSENVRLNYEICWVLRVFAEKKKTQSQLVFDELNKIEKEKMEMILRDKEVQQVLNVCKSKLKKITKKKSTKTTLRKKSTKIQ